LEFDRPARLDYLDDVILPVMAIQIYAHNTREFDRCIAHLRDRFHLQEGHELDGAQLDPVLAMAQILYDKGDIQGARRLAAGVITVLDGMTSAPSPAFSSNRYRGKAHLLMGDNNAALRDLENAAHADFAALYDYFWSIKYDNMWDPIRGEPRFQAFMSLQQTHLNQQRELLAEMRRKGEVPAREDPAH
jgi:hypothetical protein